MASQRQSWVNCKVCTFRPAVKSKGSICKTCRDKAAKEVTTK